MLLPCVWACFPETPPDWCWGTQCLLWRPPISFLKIVPLLG